MNRILILVPLLVLLFAGCPTGAVVPVDVVDLPPFGNEISGWACGAAMRIAENATQLFDLINGEGQVYVDNGFVKSAFQDYVGDIGGNEVELELRVFDMGDSTNAADVYDAVAGGAETPWTENAAGDEARVDASALFSYRVDFRGERFYVSVLVMQKSDPALDLAKLFALNVAAAIEAGAD